VSEVVPSEELRAVLLRMHVAMTDGDVDAIGDLFSAEPYLVILGTDPDEWATGPSAVNLYQTQVREMAGRTITHGEPSAYCCGSVGWVAMDTKEFHPSGVEITGRTTAVLAIEHGHWRIVQWHFSILQSNEAVGIALTTSVEQLGQLVQRERVDLRPAAAPDGTVTIAFSDIESSTMLLDRLGDTDFMALLAWHDRIVRETAEAHRGYIVKSQGDGFMIAFPSAASALRASLTMRDRIAAGYGGLPVRIRIGLHCGEALRHDDDFYGRTVVIAARVGALALGGEVLVTDLVYNLARGLGTFAFGPPRSAALKGLEGTFDLYPVLA
jgi:class 3 adenylate cyclase